MTPEEQFHRMVVAGQKEIGASDPADEYFLQAALRELRKIHLGNRGTLMQAVLDITELKL